MSGLRPPRGDGPASGGEHEGLPHDFVPGAFDGLCNYVDPDSGLRCGFGESEWEDDIVGAPIHNRPEWDYPGGYDRADLLFGGNW